MNIYYFNLCALCFMMYVDFVLQNKISNRTLALFLCYLAFVDGLRMNTGTDWLPYWDHFHSINGPVVSRLDVEIGYEWLVSLFSAIPYGYSGLLLLIAFVVYFMIYYQAYRFGGGLISVFLLYAILTPYLGANRQMLALGILAVSLPFVFKRRLILFFASVLVASLFHVSALLFIPVYFIASERIKILHIVGVVALVTVFVAYGLRFDNLIGPWVNLITNKMGYYLGDPAKFGSEALLGVGKIVFLLALPLSALMLRAIPAGTYKSENLFRIFAKCAVAYVFIYVISFSGFAALNSRGSIYYFGLFFPLLVGYAGYKIRPESSWRLTYFLAVSVAGFLIAYSGFSAYPDLFSPYESVFDDRFVKDTY